MAADPDVRSYLDKNPCLYSSNGVIYCNMCLSQIPFISSTLPGSAEMSRPGDLQIFRPAKRGTILFGGERAR